MSGAGRYGSEPDDDGDAREADDGGDARKPDGDDDAREPDDGGDAAGLEDVLAGPPPFTPRSLAALRERPDRRRAALLVAAIVGLALAWLHWLGLFVAGALVGLASESLPKAVAAGLAVGVLVLVVHVGASPVATVGNVLGLAPAAYVTVAAGLLAPAWGSLVRGVV